MKKAVKMFAFIAALALVALFASPLAVMAAEQAETATAVPESAGVLSWISQNLGAVVAIITATLGVAAMVCKLTPTPKDDAVVAKILAWLNMIPKKTQ